MIKLFLLLDDIIYIVIIVALLLWALSMRSRMKGLDNPELWLTRKERHARALEKLKEADDIERQARLQKDLEFIQGYHPTHKENQ